MVEIAFLPANRKIRVPAGTTILEAARMAGIVVESPCNGAGICGKCRVKLISPNEATTLVLQQEHRLSSDGAKKRFVLACRTEARTDLVVEIDAASGDTGETILSYGENLARERDPFITKKYFPSEDRTAVYGGETLLGFEKGNTEDENFGVVVDIGTTTLVASLVDLETGRERSYTSALNPQAMHAQDVLSRIKLASEPSGLSLMYSDIINEISRLIAVLADEARIDPVHIYEVVFSGNTCMLHLATRTEPRLLGKFPYRPVIMGGESVRAAEHGLPVSSFGLIFLPPVISAYVGADITSGILASRLHERKGATLFVDIGTNGEMVLAVNGKMVATSTAAGPAFEGMNIACGMRAAKGAIERFTIGPRGRIRLKTIGSGPATGICGSGLLDIVAELINHGAIDSGGRFKHPGALPAWLGKRIQKRDGKIAFALADHVFLTQRDIRQVQLAKGAIRAGIEYLLDSQGIDAEAVDKVLIAGSFGYHVRSGSLGHIGLLPAVLSDRIEVVGNTSQSGGRAFLLNRHYRREMMETVKRISVIELSNHHDFEKVFVRCLGF